MESAEKKCCPWVIGSGASSHRTKEKHVMVNFQEFDKPENVALGDGRVVKALGSGSVRMDMLFEATESKKAVLYDVLYMPKLTCNLFSVRAAVAKGNAAEVGPQECCIWDENGTFRGMKSLAVKLYQLDCQVAPTADTAYASVASFRVGDLWHQRLGHVHEPCLKKCVESKSVYKRLTSRKCLSCPSVADVWQGRCVEQRFPQWERSGRRRDYSLCTLTSAVQYTRPRLEEPSILLRVLMITLGAVLKTS